MERALQLHGALKPPEDGVGIAQKKEKEGEGEGGLEKQGVMVDRVVALLEPISSLWDGMHSKDLSEESFEQKKSAIRRAGQQLKSGLRSSEETMLQLGLDKLLASCKMREGGSRGQEKEQEKEQEEIRRLKSDLEQSLKANLEIKSQSDKSVEALKKQLEEEERKCTELRKKVESFSSNKTEEAAQISSSSSHRQASLEAENLELRKEIESLKGQLAKAQAENRRKEAASSSAGGGESQSLRQELLTLRGELGMARTQMEKTRQEQIASDVRLRAEREKVQDLNKVIEGKDETIARLRSDLRGLQGSSSSQGEADTFEAVLAEEMQIMRESFEQKIASLKAQMEREILAFAKERKEMKEHFDKENKNLRRRLDVLQMQGKQGSED